MTFTKIAGVAFVAAFSFLQSANAQLTVAAKGAQTVTLNDRVGSNQFIWTSEAPLEKIKGSAEGVKGSFSIDPKNLAGIRGTISAEVSTMKTGNTTRDGHLKGGQWLDAGKYPQITFTIANVSDVKASGNSATGVAHGKFSLHGVSKQIAVPFKLTYIDESEKTKARAAGDLVMITANFNVALKDYEVVGAKGLVGSKVGETIDITAQLFGATGN